MRKFFEIILKQPANAEEARVRSGYIAMLWQTPLAATVFLTSAIYLLRTQLPAQLPLNPNPPSAATSIAAAGAATTVRCQPTRLNNECHWDPGADFQPNDFTDTLYGRASTPKAVAKMNKTNDQIFHRQPY